MEIVLKSVVHEIHFGTWGKKALACGYIVVFILGLCKIGMSQKIVYPEADTYVEKGLVKAAGYGEMRNPAARFLKQSDSLIEQLMEQTEVLGKTEVFPDSGGISNGSTDERNDMSTGQESFKTSVKRTVNEEMTDSIKSEIPKVLETDVVKQEISEVPAETPVKEPEELTSQSVWKVTLDGNGGTITQSEYKFETPVFVAADFAEPKRLGKEFTGWYEDKACTQCFKSASEERKELTLYAGWKEFDGFVSNEKGYITECIAASFDAEDGFLVLPAHESCIGMEAGALRNVKESVMEVYIPSNIQYIAPGTFADLPCLMFIEAASDNPFYYSKDGALYEKDGTLVAVPKE